MGNDLFGIYKEYKILILAFVYLIILILISFILLKISKRICSKENIGLGTVKSIENANESFLPSYLGYFFCCFKYF